MSPVPAVFVTIWTVMLAAIIGTALAGTEAFDQLDELPQTALSLPSGAWVAVGLAYYALSAAILYRLARRSPHSNVVFAVYVGLMAANEGWNYLLFEVDGVGWATLGMLGFAAYAIGVAVLLWQTPDAAVFWLFVPYLVWVVGYDVPWMLLTWNATR